MHAGTARQKIRDHFRRMWIFYIAGIAITLFLNNLIFTVTRPSFSDDETLKLMLLNTDVRIDADALLGSLGETGVLSVRTEALPGANIDDPMSVMMLSVKLTGGFGDLCITDAAGLAVLESRAACLDLSGLDVPGLNPVAVIHPETGQSYPGAMRSGNGLYTVILANSTNIAEARAALPALAKQITE